MYKSNTKNSIFYDKCETGLNNRTNRLKYSGYLPRSTAPTETAPPAEAALGD